ncbi:4-oxalocrotonate tautomerase [Rhodoligotrophos appendicifer]|uniref:tautomerase family protein n=1 Tax=Rhodoligotrophos appendicifer TaxID=987056 RepID=UPI0011802F65|nr:4-oxalocrotonate tautomerase family protein [Rhodoligotrophos appendicifer]
MPVVRVSFFAGRSPEKKRQIAEAITSALVDIGGSKRDAVNVIFDNFAKEDWVIGGAPEFQKKAPE